MSEQQLREWDEGDEGGGERGETENLLPMPDLIGGRQGVFEGEGFLKISDLGGGRLGAVGLKRVQQNLVVDDAKIAGERITVETADLDLSDFCGGREAGVHHAQGFGGTAHVAVF